MGNTGDEREINPGNTKKTYKEYGIEKGETSDNSPTSPAGMSSRSYQATPISSGDDRKRKQRRKRCLATECLWKRGNVSKSECRIQDDLFLLAKREI